MDIVYIVVEEDIDWDYTESEIELVTKSLTEAIKKFIECDNGRIEIWDNGEKIYSWGEGQNEDCANFEVIFYNIEQILIHGIKNLNTNETLWYRKLVSSNF